jgi:hypothetical protein
MLRRQIFGGPIVVVLMASASLAWAQVSVNIGINLPAPPPLVAVPASPVMYAPGVAANYFFYGGQYYVFANGVWHVGRRHNGPWVVLAPEYVPRPILTVPVQYYRVPPREWRQWRGEAAPRWEPRWGQRWEEQREGRRGENRGHREEWRGADRGDRREGPRGENRREHRDDR